MAGLRILYVMPRLLGPARNWSGLHDKNGHSWLIGHAKDMGFNTLWFSPFFTTGAAPVTRHGKQVSGSVYAIRDHFTLDRDFSAAPEQPDDNARRQDDDRHIRHFTAQAANAGIRVMGDLVLNHVACDHPLVIAENAALETIRKSASNIKPVYNGKGILTGIGYDMDGKTGQTMHFKFARNDDYSLSVTGTSEEIWDDVAKINYESPEAMDFFVRGKDGKQGYWKDVIDWHIDRGFSGFRCDVAYAPPSAVWQELVQHTHDRKPDVVFMAETLGDNGQANKLANARITVNGQKQKAFDLAMLGTYWWNFRDDWIIKENKRLQKVARFGGAAFPDNHDTPDTIAGHCFKSLAMVPEKQQHEIVADICLRDYAVAALISNSVYMQLGYEYCRKQISVFRDDSNKDYWKDLTKERGGRNHPLNLTARIAAINAFKQQLKQAHAIVQVDKIEGVAGQPHLVRIECALIDQKSRDKIGTMAVYVNEKPERGPVRVSKKDISDMNAGVEMERLAIEPAMETGGHMCEIKDIAAFYTPFMPGLKPDGKPENPGQSPKPPAMG